ncbi:aminoglycoside adenylyltransferase domain-containing protein [Ktedonospora formicarum]|uniref:Adenylyltransferase AadA C-terminal domain-containing protein n=1 Tax=Ktedonospora formicarum TaxID=2778364 RepID=A0A8J3MYD6_9CHLR|nr:aminoglycoside adenylyltransferase domain-containing protein [Ktedonospora formicarum]GHO49535.1 hypothetical protein KSX_76980 [Ktedonospora formicarum]
MLDPLPEMIEHLETDPTIPAEVPQLLRTLRSDMREVLGVNLLGLYLRGSLVQGDFDPLTSDIDFFAVVRQRLSQTEFAQLAAMHTRLGRLPNRYGAHLEGPYIDLGSARCFQVGERHPTIARGEELIWSLHDYNWLLERYIVREAGGVLFGPAPTSLIDPITDDELCAAVRRRLPEWLAWANRPDDPDWQGTRSHKAYVVETMCRALHTLATGELASKPQAVTWAITTLPEPYRTTAERSRIWHSDFTPDPSLNPEVMAFIRWAASQSIP